MTTDPANRLRAFRDALYAAVAGSGDTMVRDLSPTAFVSRLTQRTMRAASDSPAAEEIVGSLAAFSAASELDDALVIAETRFDTPERLSEAIYFARCLERDAPTALDVLTARRYLDAADIPGPHADLLTDRAALLSWTTFALLWANGENVRPALDSFDRWKGRYRQAYLPAHAEHTATIAALAGELDALAVSAAAVERLNGLRRLGPPLADAALSQFNELRRLDACSLGAADVATAVTQAPACPRCSYRLGDTAPTAEARRIRQAVQRALEGQQRRLAQHVVARLLARPAGDTQERLARFIEVVQASDLAGLALVLDDPLVAFLRDLLDSPDGRSDVLQRFAGAFPEVTAANLDGAVAEFRRLLEADLTLSPSLRLGDS